VSDTPRTDAAYFEPHSTKYDLAGEMKRIERELNASNERVRLLIAERDTARGYADQKWKLRQEFHDLFGTDDIAEAVTLVRGLQDRIKNLESALCTVQNIDKVNAYQDLESANDRIKRLEEALESIREYWNRDNNNQALVDACWYAIDKAAEALEAKEAKL